MNNGLSAFVNAVAESYPTLQANKQYISLTDEISGTQNRITVARGRYIENIRSMNTAVKRFPGNVIAGMFGFKSVEYYQAEAGTNTPILGTGVLP
jgi:LemA protein